MGESTCLMQTFSHPSHETQEANPVHVLGESISFGRFMTESLAWEKWSSFNNNRYLEEVEKCSKPGSVAQKKAYFEAHYKKIAAQKAAAALEEENSATYNSSQPECDDGFCDSGTLDTELVGSACHSDTTELNEAVREAEISTFEAGFSFDAQGCESNGETCGLESVIVEVDPVTENHVLEDNSMSTESPNQHEDVENRMSNEVEALTTPPSEKIPLKEISSANQESSASTMKTKQSVSSSKASIYNRESKLPFTPARPRTPVHPRKENNPTLSSKKTAKDATDKRRPTSTSLHMSLNFTPTQASETNKRPTPILQNTRDSKVSATSTKTSSDCSNSLRTPARLQASRNGVPKRPPLTPYPDSRRIKAPLEHAVHGSRKMDVKWKSLSVDPSKSSSAFENKAWSPSVSSSFSLKSEERAAKRKEYFRKLEEEYNAKEAQKLELETKSKEKAETELRKLRQNLGFKAKPMPDFYRETQLPKTELKKIPLTRPRSPKLGRKPCSSASHETSPLPAKRPLVKSDGSTQAIDKARQTQTRSVRSTPKKNAHENASPNIQCC